ncbi:VanZ family protein [Rubrivirga litoralis]|uniref:VanZ family protein n=1 Tax=Rubrivirga litoralis TaxID=3075598 RepID=A0ABU3BUM4_9BACT|nr:VanZ family protein [Rubrivirga sp. F394]MDT0632994.1 VanZ family protein [Rubrivirga sp. F394]
MTTRRLAVVWTVLIVVACTIPGNQVPDVELRLVSPDKVVHVLMFLGLAWLWLRAGSRTWAVVAGGAAFALAIEVWQTVLPIGRFGDPYDVLADLVGLAAGVALGLWSRRTAASGRGGAA